ncbi:MAG: mersacidin/lichenicidin family type 2 lantibiotic [Catenulispora sp.]|nr:mersacidin/lichenicidin family type 2 lantibiotic [Catenulispora sp.]
MYDIIRAWKDEDYREEVHADPGTHPAGTIDLAAAQPASSMPLLSQSTSLDAAQSACDISHCADICSATTCFDAVGSISWDDPVLTGV